MVPMPVYKFVTRPTALPVTKVTDRAIGLATNLVINIGHMIGETGLKVVQRSGFEALRKVRFFCCIFFTLVTFELF